MRKFKIGDKVILRPFKSTFRSDEGIDGSAVLPDGLYVNEHMKKMAGVVTTIIESRYNGRYSVAHNSWAWTSDILDLYIEEPKLGGELLTS